MVASSSAFALEGRTSNTADRYAEIDVSEHDAIVIGFSHPQSLSVSSPNNVANRAASSVINRTWHVVSNNAVTVKFTGRSPDANGVLTNAPTFYKAEIGADGEQIGTQYDHLVTNFSASINNMEEGQGTLTGAPHWGGTNQYANEYGYTEGAATGIQTLTGVDYFTEDGPKPLRIDQTANFNALNDYIALGTPEELVNVAGNSFGTIMPDDNGKFSMTLSSRGVGDVATTQSGDYQITVVASFIAAELGNYTTIEQGESSQYDYNVLGNNADPATVSALTIGDEFDARSNPTYMDDTSRYGSHYADNSDWSWNYDYTSGNVDAEGNNAYNSKSATVYGEEVSVSVDNIARQSGDICASNSDYRNEDWCKY